MADHIYINGRRVNEELPLRSIFFGEGVFETFRYKSKLPLHFDKHIERLRAGAELLKLDIPEANHLIDLINASVSDSGMPDVYFKLCILSGGSNSFYEKSLGIQVLTLIKEYPTPKKSTNACLSRFYKNSSSPILRIKSFNYLENIIARREAHEKGYDEVIFLNERGDITEGSAGNIFWYKGGMLYTPSVDCGLLAGTTREVLFDIREELGIEIEEGAYTIEDLLSSEFAFFTNSLIGSALITRLGDHEFSFSNKTFTFIRNILLKELGWI